MDGTAGSETEFENVTGYVPEQIAQEIDQYAEENDLSRSKAVRELLETAISSRWYGQKLDEAQSYLYDPNSTAFVCSVAYPSGDVATITGARGPGLETDSEFANSLSEDVGDQAAALYLARIGVLTHTAETENRSVEESGASLTALATKREGDTFYKED